RRHTSSKRDWSSDVCSSDLLLMPKTDFPMRGNLPNKEPVRRAAWDEDKVYEQSIARTKGRPTFILHDGPPYANGDLHIGHALNRSEERRVGKEGRSGGRR